MGQTNLVLHPTTKHWYPSGCMCVSLLCLAQEEGSPNRAPHTLHSWGLAPVLLDNNNVMCRRAEAPKYLLNIAMGLQARELGEGLAAIDANMWPAGGGEKSDANRDPPRSFDTHFSPVCSFSWRLRSPLRWKSLLQTSHIHCGHTKGKFGVSG